MLEREERKENREEKRKKRDGSVPEGRDGEEKGRPLERGGKSAKRSEKRETNTIKMRGPQKAIVRSQNGEAQGRVDWKRDGWPDAKFEGTSAK